MVSEQLADTGSAGIGQLAMASDSHARGARSMHTLGTNLVYTPTHDAEVDTSNSTLRHYLKEKCDSASAFDG